MAEKHSHPEQDPVEGDREIIDKELARQDQKMKGGAQGDDRNAKPAEQNGKR